MNALIDPQTPLAPPTPNFDDPAFQRWIRPPAGREHDPHTGLRRTSLNAFVQRTRGRVRTLLVADKGAKRGCRLIWLPDLLRELHTEAAVQMAQPGDLTEEQLAALPPAGAHH